MLLTCRVATTFQFHLGAINGGVFLSLTKYNTIFQFHLGAINGGNPYHPGEETSDFNSTLVRLTVNPKMRVVPFLTFQFHLGAINGRTIKVERPLYSLFQFHLGAINGQIFRILILGQLHFNSTLVRLTERA